MVNISRVSRSLNCSKHCYSDILSPPTKERGPHASKNTYFRRVFKQHSLEPSNFRKLTENIDLDWLLPKVAHPFHFNDVVLGTSRLHKKSSAGAYIRHRFGYRYKDDALKDPKVVQALRVYCHKIKSEPKFFPLPLSSLAATSTKVSIETGEPKTRFAVVFPLHALCAEQMFAEPFLRYYEKQPHKNFEDFKYMHNKCCGKSTYSLDFKCFDTSVPRWLVCRALHQITKRIDFSMYYGGAKPYAANSLRKLWYWVCSLYLSTPVKHEGKVLVLRDGVPSGVMLTVILNSVISALIAEYVSNVSRFSFSYITHGDDTILWNVVSPSYVEQGYNNLGFKITLDAPNKHGCTLFNKAECHGGYTFRPGVWFSNILNCAHKNDRGFVAYMLQHYRPVLEQSEWLEEMMCKYGVWKSRRLAEKLRNLKDFGGAGKTPSFTSL